MTTYKVLLLISGISCYYGYTHAQIPFWRSLNLPEEHISYFFRNNPEIEKKCQQDDNCPYMKYTSTSKCWGYEKNCPVSNRMHSPECPKDISKAWAKDKATQIENFWKEGDFGYIKERQGEMKTFCKPQQPGDSLLQCSSFTRYCRATNVFLDFTDDDFYNSKNRYREDMFKTGEIGGKCKLNSAALKKEGQHKSPLQSWFAELENFTELKSHPIEDKLCDIVLDKPTFLIKLDAGVNMYHHFCDYVNLYASQHMNNSFSQDIDIVMWDTSGMKYGDFFHDTWKAFSRNPIIQLSKFEGKKVCIRDAVFPLLARMRRGLYYNMPLTPGCHSSSLFKAFSQHVLHRLGIKQRGPRERKIRVTLLSRGSKYRKILNQEELVNAMKTVGDYEVRVVDYNREIPFLQQLDITHNSDMFMGMHGAGLTHMIFLPDWATGFEIYNCEDKGCYSDLAYLRGVNYMTWENKNKLIQEDEGHHPTLGAHAKFTNYEFDVGEFMRMVAKGVNKVRNHPAFKAAWQEKWGTRKQEEKLQNEARVEL